MAGALQAPAISVQIIGQFDFVEHFGSLTVIPVSFHPSGV